MRRVTEKRVTVNLAMRDVYAAVASMARCPVHLRDSARVEFGDDDATVSWSETSSRKPQSNKVELVGMTFGKWQVLGHADPRVTPSGVARTMFRCLCTGCNSEHDVGSQALQNGDTRGCQACHMAEITVPPAERICEFCGVQLTPKSKMPRRCTRCDRQQVRRGVCPCGKSVNMAFKPCRHCGRVDGKAGPDV